MSKYLLCGAALAALLTAPSADAADLTPSWGPAPFNWSGFYAGAVAGAAWGAIRSTHGDRGRWIFGRS
jgi:opacity protein-like surface antigen